MNSLETRFESELGKVYKSEWKLIDQETINIFGKVTDDEQAIHMDPEYAKNSLYGGIVAHGFLTASLISAAIGTKLPGPGSIYLNQSLNYQRTTDSISPVQL